MKITLENFGPIHRVEFDLSKDLNVIFGKNNIGKSYAITALYILLKHLLAGFRGGHIYGFGSQRLFKAAGIYGFPAAFTQSFQEVEATGTSSPLIAALTEARGAFRKNQDLLEYDLSAHLTPLLQQSFASMLEELLTNSFNNSFQSVEGLTNFLSEGSLRIVVESSEISLFLSARDNAIVLDDVKLRHTIVARRSKLNLRPAVSEGHTTVYFKMSALRKGDQARQIGEDAVAVVKALRKVESGFADELRSVTHAIYFLPASRSGLYQALSTFGALFAELSKSRTFVTKGISLPNISEPVADYFLQLSNMKPEAEDGEVSAIARQIEQEVLGGEVGFNEQTKKLYFRQQGMDQEMDLSFASSMISEIAPIVAYFKYILREETAYETRTALGQDGNPLTEKTSLLRLPPSLIFIEEPEAHLHPAVQVKLLEFFARLTKHNVKVVMTSHSNYMFNKLSNLLLAGELEPEKVGSYLMRATPEGSVMDATAMRAEEEGIVDENFVDVAEQLYNERLEAYDKQGDKA